MIKKITLSVGTTLNNSLLLPNLDSILLFSKGDFNIAQKILITSIYRNLSAGNYEKEIIEIFLEASGMKTLNDLNTYKSNIVGGGFFIPEDEIIPKVEHVGSERLEITTMQTIFELMKPYLEVSELFSESMVDFEDIIARLSSGSSLFSSIMSLKPKFNTDSLYSKRIIASDNIDRVKRIINDSGSSKFSKLTTKQKKEGIDMAVLNSLSLDKKKFIITTNSGSEFNWKILNIEYSTIVKLEGVDYNNIYKDLLDDRILIGIDSGNEDKGKLKYGKTIIGEIKKPPVIVFSIYDSTGKEDDILDYKWKWLSDNYQTGIEGPQDRKWYGRWKQLNPTDKGDYESYIMSYIENRLRIKGNNNVIDKKLLDEVFSFITSKLNTQDIINAGNINSFMNLIVETNPSKGLDLGDDNSPDVGVVTGNRRRMFLPKEIEYKGEKVFIDPESDYYLQIIKLQPNKRVLFNSSIDKDNNQLRRTTPLVGNYLGNNVEDVMESKNYTTQFLRQSHTIRTKEDKARVLTIDKFKSDSTNTADSNKFDTSSTYIVEGILKDKKLEESKASTTLEDKKYYSGADYQSTTTKFIDAIIDVSIDLLPKLIETRELFESPHELIFDKMLEKVGDNFEFFSNELIEKFTMADKIVNIEEKVEFVSEDLLLKKFVFIDEETGKMKLSMDSVSIFGLLGFNFGVQLTNMKPKLIISKNNRGITDQNSLSSSTNSDFSNTLIGDTISSLNLDYNNFYDSKKVDELIKKGDELFKIASIGGDATQDLDSAISSMQNYTEALMIEPNNKVIQDRINVLKREFKIQMNMMFQFLMDFVSLPIKIVHNIIVKMIDFFELLTLENIETDIVDFLKFEWISDHISKSKILEFLGIKFNTSILIQWLDGLNNGNYNDFSEFNLDLIMSMPFIGKLPTVTGAELKVIGLKPLYSLNKLLQFIEKIVNEIIKYIFDVLNVNSVLSFSPINISGDVPYEL